MDFLWFPLFLIFVITFFYYYKMTNSRTATAINWPIVGMFPDIIRNAHRIRDYATECLQENRGTMEIKGIWFANMDMLLTSDPSNIQYMFSKNFSNYPKGPLFKEIFDILGDGIFNADSQKWEVQRKIILSWLNHSRFHIYSQTILWDKIEKSLIPFFELVTKQGLQVDLQQIFQRFTFDFICLLTLDYDPESLSMNLLSIPYETAFSDAEEALFYRHILPAWCWKMQKWLQIGKEKKLTEAAKVVDQFIYHRISLKRLEINKKKLSGNDEDDAFCLITGLLDDVSGKNLSDKFLRDTILSLLFAGRDSTSAVLAWFFWFVAKNPESEMKIFKEIENKIHGDQWRCLSVEELRELIYLHGALCETLRLFPPLPFNHKSPLEPDVLPSGHRIDSKSKIILSFYSTGRMESIWGKDFLTFKPERWISEKGDIRYEPPFRFPAFNVGPRTCLGKELAFVQMKAIAASIIYNYHVQLVDGHQVVARDSLILQMKYGLKVRLTKRNL